MSHRRWQNATLEGHSPCSLPNDRLVLQGPELRDANTTAMLFCTVAGSVFLLARDVSRGTFAADVHVINGSSMKTTNLLSENIVRFACCLCLGCLVLCCVVYMYLLSQTPFCLIAADSVVMFNSTTTERWPFPRYFEYNIVCGPGNTRVEWTRVYIPGHAVAESVNRPRMTCLLIVRFYHFEVYWPRDSTGGTIADSPAQPVSYASFYS